jgi:Domain of unknown function (DUF4397)
MLRSTLRRSPAVLAVLTVLAVTLLLVLAMPPLAAPVSAAPAQAMLRVAQLSPDAGTLTVRVDGKVVTTPVRFPTVSSYLWLPAEQHTVQLRGSGVEVSSRTTFAAGSATTVAVMGRAAHPLARVFHDQLLAPPAGDSRIRVVHAAPGVPPADVVASTGTVLFANIAFTQDPGYRAVPAGTYSVVMRRAGTSAILLAAKGIAVQPGAIYSIWAVGGGGTALRLVRTHDASGMARPPAGGVATGYGGTAPGRSDHATPGLAAVLVGLVATAAWLGRRGWRGRRRRSGSGRLPT